MQKPTLRCCILQTVAKNAMQRLAYYKLILPQIYLSSQLPPGAWPYPNWLLHAREDSDVSKIPNHHVSRILNPTTCNLLSRIGYKCRRHQFPPVSFNHSQSDDTHDFYQHIIGARASTEPSTQPL